MASDAPIPLDFGPESRVLWKTTVPMGHSSPCVVGDRVVLTGSDEGKLVVFALDRGTGEFAWTREFEAEPEPAYKHVAAAPAQPSPCSDGERVFAYFGSYGLIALDLGGEVLWEKKMPMASQAFGTGTSPIVAGGRVILMRDGAPEGAVLAFDAKSGEQVWSIPRFGFIESHSSPFLWRNAGRDELVIAGTRQLRSYDPSDGKELWRFQEITLVTCTTPTADADTLYFAGWSTPNSSGKPMLDESFAPFVISDAEAADVGLLFARLDQDKDEHLTRDEVPASRARDAFAFIDGNGNGTWEQEELVGASTTSKAPGENVMVAINAGGEGDVSKSHLRWSWKRSLPYVSSPLLYRDRLWLVKAGGVVTCLDSKTGEPIIARERLAVGGEYYMSPVGAGGHVLIGAEQGTLFIIDGTRDELSVIHTADFDEGIYATPAVVNGKVYLRTRTTLWAFGK